SNAPKETSCTPPRFWVSTVIPCARKSPLSRSICPVPALTRGEPLAMAFAFSDPLYVIADAHCRHGALEIVEAAVNAGVRLLQLRVKDTPTRSFVELAQAAKRLTDRHQVDLIINDRADIALLVDSSGVHLGGDDLPARDARALLGPSKVIGLSTHSPA